MYALIVFDDPVDLSHTENVYSTPTTTAPDVSFAVPYPIDASAELLIAR
jgi:hypothetical protein